MSDAQNPPVHPAFTNDEMESIRLILNGIVKLIGVGSAVGVGNLLVQHGWPVRVVEWVLPDHEPMLHEQPVVYVDEPILEESTDDD